MKKKSRTEEVFIILIMETSKVAEASEQCRERRKWLPEGLSEYCQELDRKDGEIRVSLAQAASQTLTAASAYENLTAKMANVERSLEQQAEKIDKLAQMNEQQAEKMQQQAEKMQQQEQQVEQQAEKMQQLNEKIENLAGMTDTALHTIVMPGCGGVLPELTVASCQNSVCTLFLVVYFFPRFPSKFRSPVRRHVGKSIVGKSCWKEHCWKELLERACLEQRLKEVLKFV